MIDITEDAEAFIDLDATNTESSEQESITPEETDTQEEGAPQTDEAKEEDEDIETSEKYNTVLLLVEKAVSLKDQSLISFNYNKAMKLNVYRNLFTPYIKVPGFIKESFDETTQFNDNTSRLEMAVPLNYALEAIYDPERGTSYKYAYVDLTMTSSLFEGNTIRLKSQLQDGAFYEVSNSWTGASYTFYIESQDRVDITKQMLLNYDARNQMDFFDNGMIQKGIPHFKFVKYADLETEENIKNEYDSLILCKSFFSEKVDRFKNVDLSSSEIGQTLSLEGFCDERGNELVYNKLINKQLVLKNEHMLIYIEYLIKSNNYHKDRIFSSMEHIRNVSESLYEEYLDAYNESIDYLRASTEELQQARNYILN